MSSPEDNDWFEAHGLAKGPDLRHWFWGRYLGHPSWMVRDAAQEALIAERTWWRRWRYFRLKLKLNRQEEAFRRLAHLASAKLSTLGERNKEKEHKE